MARKKDPNSKRQIQLREKEERRKRKEAEQKAQEAIRQAEQLKAQLEEKQALEEKLAQLQSEKEQRLQEQAEREKQLAEEQLRKEQASQEQAKEEPAIEEPEEVEADHDQDDEDDLLAQLAKATAPKKVKQETVQEDPEEQPAEEPTAQEDLDGDFEEDFSGDFDPPVAKEEPKQTLHDSEKENKVRFKVDEGEMSDILVDGLESMFTMICPTSFKKAAFTKEELARMRRINHEFTNGEDGPTLDDEDLELMERYQEFEKYLEGLPLTDAEKGNLKAPLKVMLKDKGGDIPPGWALVFAAFTISMPRLSPIVMMRIAKFMAKQFESKTEEKEN